MNALLPSRSTAAALFSSVCAVALGVVLGGGHLSAQSLSYSRGQNVSPAYEGWEEDESGNKFFLFGYMNRNWEEEVDVPVGADNGFSPGAPDQGQPTRFLPRRNRFVFRVPVPKGFTDKDELIWTLTTKGKTEKAYATTRTDYKVDDVVKASETGALGAGTSSPEVRANKPPAVKVEGEKKLSVKVGQSLSITTLVTDDGIPKRRLPGLSGSAVSNVGSRRDVTQSGEASQNPVVANRLTAPPVRVTVGKNVGLHLSWFVYRGTGRVTFDPEQIVAWEDTRAGANSPWAPIWIAPEMPADGKVVVHATFSEPGVYTLRARADDGALLGDDEVTVTVTK
jgi:autonomous glycyl radical cofactor GrcA